LTDLNCVAPPKVVIFIANDTGISKTVPSVSATVVSILTPDNKSVLEARSSYVYRASPLTTAAPEAEVNISNFKIPQFTESLNVNRETS